MEVRKYLLWKAEKTKITVIFENELGMSGKIEIGKNKKVRFGVVPDANFWMKWCPYIGVDANFDEPSDELKRAVEKIVETVEPRYPVGGNKERAIEWMIKNRKH